MAYILEDMANWFNKDGGLKGKVVEIFSVELRERYLGIKLLTGESSVRRTN